MGKTGSQGGWQSESESLIAAVMRVEKSGL